MTLLLLFIITHRCKIIHDISSDMLLVEYNIIDTWMVIDILSYHLPSFSMFMEPSSSTLVTIEINEEDDDYNKHEVRPKSDNVWIQEIKL